MQKRDGSGKRKPSDRKRGNGEGSIFQEASGRYRIAVTRWEGDRRVRRTRTAWKHSEAVAILSELRGEKVVPIGVLTVAGHLKKWLLSTVDKETNPGTYDSYNNSINNHINPGLGHHLLKNLTPAVVEDWVVTMRENEVGGRTIELAFVVLRAAMIHAHERLKLIKDNPCALLKKPPHESEEIFPFTLSEAKKILAKTVGTRDHAILQLALTAGLRQGEIFGIAPQNIRWDDNQILVDQQVVSISGKTFLKKPKTKSSIRVVDITDSCKRSMQDHQTIRAAEGFEGNDLFFCAPQGGMICRSTFRTRVWAPLLKTMFLDHRGFHHARHTYATIALGNGVDLAVVSRQLGHKKTSTTADTYWHAMKAHKSVGTKVIARLFG